MYYDKEFLKKLDKERNRDIYARITLLTKEEYPVEFIEGKVTGGSINIDGTSCLRRTCNLSMVSANLDANIYYLGLERKFILEIGLENKIDSSYPKIIWFKEGIFVTTGVTTSRQASSYSISITGKDKMCLLNGDVAGSLPYSVIFDTLEEISEDGTTVQKTKVKVRDIIRHAVEELGGEQPYNIIINDLEDAGLTLLDYKGDKDQPGYAFRLVNSPDICTNITFDGDQEVHPREDKYVTIKLKDIPDDQLDDFEKFSYEGENKPAQFYTYVYYYEPGFPPGNDSPLYTIVKIESGHTIGYRQTDVIYPDELIGNIGDSLTSILDKLVEMLVNYEYFYDVDGRFVFQKKRSFVTWGKPLEREGLNEKSFFFATKEDTELFYNFEDNDLVVSFNNNPDFNNCKNDFSIWGNKKGITGNDIPIHLRFAIDRKPKSYVTYKPAYTKIKAVDGDTKEYQEWASYPQYEYVAGPDGSWYESGTSANGLPQITCDWREIIYQMALDYYKFKDTQSDFYHQIITNNIDPVTQTSRYPTGRTQYEQYYTDILGFWRQLFSPVGKFSGAPGPEGFFRQVILSPKSYKQNFYYTKDKVYTEAEVSRVGQTNLVTIEIDEDMVDRFPVYTLDSHRQFDENKIYYERYDDLQKGNCFNQTMHKDPTCLDFWFDFLDTQGELGKYSVRAIGQRPKDVNNSNVKSIYYRDTPNLIFRDPYSIDAEQKLYYSSSGDSREETTTPEEFVDATAYRYINSNQALENCLTVSTQGVSAMDTLQSYLNEFTFCKENTSLTTIPVYYMEPNVRVSIKDLVSKVDGEYIVNKVTIPLTYNGTMSMNVVKLIDEVR